MTVWKCPSCGMIVTGGEDGAHRCDASTLAARFEERFRAWLQTPEGRFATFYAQREVKTGG